MFERIVSIPSPSGLLQNHVPSWALEWIYAFQSLLLQVSFKTSLVRRRIEAAFQSLLLQVSFKTRWVDVTHWSMRFNPFSFRSPSKQ